MVIFKNNSLCEQAQIYYYDYLLKEHGEFVPESINNHIEHCPHCRGQINELNDMLSPHSDVNSNNINNAGAISTLLKLHFTYVGKKVTCRIVQPFLPVLLEPALRIKIPTPITVHLDKCPQCSGELEKIRNFNLNSQQLYRLSQFLAAKPADDNVSCSQGQSSILAFVSFALHQTNKQVLKHLCLCSDCRKAVYEYRQAILNEHLQEKEGRQECSLGIQVSISDLFDYVMPYGIDPATDQYAASRNSLTSHIFRCPKCLAKMQELHRAVFDIVEQPESQVATIYHIGESQTTGRLNDSEAIYPGLPIRIETENPIEESIPTTKFSTALRKRIAVSNVKPLIKSGIAAAAVLLIASALFFYSSPAKAVGIAKIYSTIEKIKNVYISSFTPDKTEPVQERWISRDLNIYLTKTGGEFVLWDIKNKEKRIKQSDIGSIEINRPSNDMLADVEKIINNSLGMMPFDKISDVPPNAEWEQVNNAELKNPVKDTEVFDLMWTGNTYNNSVIFYKWRFFIDLSANIPKRTELYRKLPSEDNYNLTSVNIIEYLNDDEMQMIVNKAFAR